jgi:hypothetical protein
MTAFDEIRRDGIVIHVSRLVETGTAYLRRPRLNERPSSARLPIPFPNDDEAESLEETPAGVKRWIANHIPRYSNKEYRGRKRCLSKIRTNELDGRNGQGNMESDDIGHAVSALPCLVLG